MRCAIQDRKRGVAEFDRALFGHIGFAISNAVRSLLMALTLARFERVPESGPTRRYYQHIERFSASFAFATDVAMLTLGGYLKKKETISARLGDVLSAMYLASMVLKHHENQGQPGRGAADRSNGPAASCSIRRRSSCTACCAISPTGRWRR